MKKILLRLCLALVVLVVLICLGIHFFLDSAVKKGVETIGPKLTKVNVQLDGVHISLLSGSGKITVNGRPFETPGEISGTIRTASGPSSSRGCSRPVPPRSCSRSPCATSALRAPRSWPVRRRSSQS